MSDHFGTICIKRLMKILLPKGRMNWNNPNFPYHGMTSVVHDLRHANRFHFIPPFYGDHPPMASETLREADHV